MFSFLLLIPVLFVLILVHEFGHYITAKKTGMRVDEFGIGFPPKAFSFTRGETVYSINWLPIGGFVRIFGEDAAEAGEDTDRAFGARPTWAQVVVLVAGVTMNVLLAWLIFVGVFMAGFTVGIPESEYSDASELLVANVLPDSPAATANMPVGEVVGSVQSGGDTLETLTPSAFRDFTTAREAQDILITFENGESVTLVPQSGVLEDAPEQVVIGVALALQQPIPGKSLPGAMGEATVTTIDSLQAITIGIFSLIRDSFIGAADFSQVAGPVGIGVLVGQAADVGVIPLLLLTATLSLSLAVINLLPFPALDGGRLLMVFYEAITKKPINPEWVMRINFAGFILLMLLMVLVTWNDIIRIW